MQYMYTHTTNFHWEVRSVK